MHKQIRSIKLNWTAYIYLQDRQSGFREYRFAIDYIRSGMETWRTSKNGSRHTGHFSTEREHSRQQTRWRHGRNRIDTWSSRQMQQLQRRRMLSTSACISSSLLSSTAYTCRMNSESALLGLRNRTSYTALESCKR